MIQVNTQQSGGTGRSSLWMERCQVYTKAEFLAEMNIFQFQWQCLLRSCLFSQPRSKLKWSSAPQLLPRPDKLFQVQFLIIWSQCRGYNENYLLQLVQNMEAAKPFQQPILNIYVLSQNFKLWLPVGFFPLLSPNKNVLPTVIRFFLRYDQI